VVEARRKQANLPGWWFPIQSGIHQRFASIEKVDRIRSPLLIVHGRQDENIPFQHGQALYEVATPDTKRLKLFPDLGHVNIIYDQQVADTIQTFLKDLGATQPKMEQPASIGGQ
jgi:hypothetical protein